ncbi:MAG: hypothetical protein JXB60_01910 [Candidatus Cloacimonetes bacterium]|nr:hypothetical protein [Candidatus Cloacimonadota bacterium]
MKKVIILCIVLMLISYVLSAQDEPLVNQKSELITLLKATSFVEAIRAIEQLSQTYEGRKIINLSSYTGEIGLPIKQIYWREALQLIVDFNGLELKELPGVYQINDPEMITASGGETISPDTKQVRISAIFVKINESFSNSVGIDWSTLINGEVIATVNFKGASQVADELFNASTTKRLETGDYTVDINTLFKILEANEQGTIMARPNIIVLSGKTGFIQVGEDFSVKTLDEEGNTIDRFFETGIIMEVTPTIIQQGEDEAIHLAARVEKSTAFPGEISTIISKSTSETEILLYDGEETVIGGLYDVDEKTVRQGIPFFKDLPWWVLGIRYLTGYNRVEKATGEMIIILKVQILEPIEVRREERVPIKDRIHELRLDNREINNLVEEKLPVEKEKENKGLNYEEIEDSDE